MSLQPAGPTTADPYLVHLGNVHANTQWVVTPTGSWPTRDVNITAVDQTSTTTTTPAWAIVLVVVFIWFFLLSLLFLLARERRVAGFVSVHIQCGAQSFNDQIPVSNDLQRTDVMNRVTYLQWLIGQARTAPVHG